MKKISGSSDTTPYAGLSREGHVMFLMLAVGLTLCLVVGFGAIVLA